VLQTYTYLRDSQVKEFHHKAMTGALWERLGDLPQHLSPVVPGVKPRGGQAAEGGADTKCSHCAVKELNRLANVPGQRNFCPLRDLTDRAKAKEAAKWIIDQKRSDPSKNVQELIVSAKIKFGG
jgi:hypothetical protein